MTIAIRAALAIREVFTAPGWRLRYRWRTPSVVKQDKRLRLPCPRLQRLKKVGSRWC